VVGSNNAGIWGQSPQPPEVSGGSEAEPSTLRRFFQLFPKKYAFLNTLWSKFLLENTFKMTTKSVLLHPQGLHPRACAPTCPLLATPLTGSNKWQLDSKAPSLSSGRGAVTNKWVPKPINTYRSSSEFEYWTFEYEHKFPKNSSMSTYVYSCNKCTRIRVHFL